MEQVEMFEIQAMMKFGSHQYKGFIGHFDHKKNK